MTINIFNLKTTQCSDMVFRVMGITEADIDGNDLVAKREFKTVLRHERRLNFAPVDRLVWSVGRRKIDGAIFMAFDARYYDHPKFNCIWLR